MLSTSILSHTFSVKEEEHKNSSSDNIGHTVANASVIWKGTDGNYIHHGTQCVMHIIVESLGCTPEMNMLHVNSTSLKK